MRKKHEKLKTARLLPKLQAAHTRKYLPKGNFFVSKTYYITRMQALHRNKITAKLENFHTKAHSTNKTKYQR